MKLGDRARLNETEWTNSMKLSAIGIWPRVGLAFVPWLAGELADRWFQGCFGSQSPFCIYYFHPPVMDVMFALLVLVPFIATHRFVVLRVVALIVLSVFVHYLAIGLLTGTRGSLEIPGVDSIFLNVIPIAVIASIVTVAIAAFACGFRPTRRLLVHSMLAGMPVALLFLLFDSDLAAGWLPVSDNWYWAVWHVSICIAIYYGRTGRPGVQA